MPLQICGLKGSLEEYSNSTSKRETICPCYMETRPAGNIYIGDICFKVAKTTSSKKWKKKKKTRFPASPIKCQTCKRGNWKEESNLQSHTKHQVRHKNKLTGFFSCWFFFHGIFPSTYYFWNNKLKCVSQSSLGTSVLIYEVSSGQQNMLHVRF